MGDLDAEGPRQVGLGVGKPKSVPKKVNGWPWTSTIWAVDIELACRNTATSARARKEIANVQTPIGAVHAVFLPWVSRLTSCATPSRPPLS
ncbi:MAG: hypothetical protein R2719_05105 [Micropruina sp.]